MSSITPAEVAGRMQQGQTIELIDVRTPMEFEQCHAQGATSLPLDRLEPAKVLAKGPADRAVYVICKSGGRSTKAVEQLRAAGLLGAVSVDGGTDAWASAGLPVVRGASRVWSLERQVRVGVGLLVLIGLALGRIHPAFLLISAFMGGGLIFAGVTDCCGMGMMLAKMPWNAGRGGSCSTR